MDRSFQGLVLSLCFHAVLVWILVRGNFADPVSQTDTTEIVIMDQGEKTGANKILMDPDNEKPPPPTPEELKKQADFLSAFTKRVKKQLASRNIGADRNAQAAQSPKGDPEGIAGDQQRGDRGEGFLAPGGGQALRTVAIGQSSLSQTIPGVEEGAFTALNTDQLEFYAFYQRSNEQIRNRWVSLIRNYVGELPARDMEILARRNRTTMLEILLTPSGDFARSVIHSSSGDKGLDQAAIEAFRLAAPFPNPPSEMVKADGFIHLYYNFTLYLRPPNFGPAVN